ncbi:DUF5808 domain-containing protein [Cellulosimicrobium cellulans]|uniref:DUF5808 domain-containing protein n=1 Tax=Cellulosimicrobium cellulans TaxID=1710 RepID=UPI0016528100|nr:DUF5808 domain-containing protein [Cellulosimicrobium cellulans]
MNPYLRAVGAHLGGLGAADRRRALLALSAQLDELADAGLDPVSVLGDPAQYATVLRDTLADDAPPGSARWRVLGLPVETRGPVSAAVRSRAWDPMDPRLVVPRLLGVGWTLNLGAVAVRAGLLRPDEGGDDVLDLVPEAQVRHAQRVPVVLAGLTAGALALAWRRLPATVPTGFGPTGRPRGAAPRWTTLGTVALGAAPAAWAQRRTASVQDRLVRSAHATSLAVVSAGVVAATLAQARAPHGRGGLLVGASLPVAAAASLAVVVVPLRSGLRRARAAGTAAGAGSPPAPPRPPEPASRAGDGDRRPGRRS